MRGRPERWGSEGGGPRGISRRVGWARGRLRGKQEVELLCALLLARSCFGAGGGRQRQGAGGLDSLLGQVSNRYSLLLCFYFSCCFLFISICFDLVQALNHFCSSNNFLQGLKGIL